MSYTFSKTFTRIPVPDNIVADVKYAEVVEQLSSESMETWFSGSHFLGDYCTWDTITDDYGNEEQTAFISPGEARKGIQSMIEECLSIQHENGRKGVIFQVYRDSDSYGDEVHDWIITHFLQDKDFGLKALKTCVVVEDSREGTSIQSFKNFLNDRGELERGDMG